MAERWRHCAEVFQSQRPPVPPSRRQTAQSRRRTAALA
jgi:hypothetical protein